MIISTLQKKIQIILVSSSIGALVACSGGGNDAEITEPVLPVTPQINYRDKLSNDLALLEMNPNLLNDGTAFSNVLNDTLEKEQIGSTLADCARQEVDILKFRNQIPAWATSISSTMPGMLVTTNGLALGEINTIPTGANRRVQLYIDASIPDPYLVVENANSSTIRAGINELVQRAQNIEAASRSSQISFESTLISSTQEFYDKADVSADFGFNAGSYGLSLDYGDNSSSSSTSAQKHLLIKLRQVMYTITFSHDDILNDVDFFGDVSEELYGKLAEGDHYNRQNPPAFIDTVAYGREVFFLLDTERSSSLTDEQEKYGLSANYQGTDGGFSAGGTNGSVSAVNNGALEVMSLGGSETDALEAIKTGDFSPFLNMQNYATAVPLSFKIRQMAGSRPIIALRDSIRYTKVDCLKCQETESIARVEVGKYYEQEGSGTNVFGSCPTVQVGPSVTSWQCSQGSSSNNPLGTKAGLSITTNVNCSTIEWANPTIPQDCSVKFYGRDGTKPCDVKCGFTAFANVPTGEGYPVCQGS